MARTLEQLYSTTEAAGVLSLHPKTVQKMIRNGDLPAFKIGTDWKIRESTLTRFVAAQERRTSNVKPAPKRKRFSKSAR